MTTPDQQPPARPAPTRTTVPTPPDRAAALDGATWQDAVPLLRARAEAWVTGWSGCSAGVVAARGGRVAFVADVRPFEDGAYHQPLVELWALGLGLGCDGLGVGATGRVWSLDEPVPVGPGGVDLRQRVLCVTTADGRAARPLRRGTVLPYDVTDGRVVWQPSLLDEAGEGWIADALVATVRAPRTVGVEEDHDEARAQLLRCRTRGHTVELSTWAAALLGVEG